MLDKVLENNMCAGCGMCESAFGSEKLNVELDASGFYRPSVKDSLNNTELEKFAKFCPGVVVRKKRELTPLYDPVWGEMYSCLIGASAEDDIRMEASSGGGISTILIYLLESKEVDAIIHIGAHKSKPYLNEIKLSVNREQVIENANSRYSASAPLKNIRDLIKTSNYSKYAFVGKPCDVAALRQYMKMDIELHSKIVYLISFFCAGVPSVNASLNIVESMGINIDSVKKIDYRKEGWPGYFRVIDKDDKNFKLSYSLTWMKLLGPTVQFRCKICPDGIGHFSDIVCADGWDNFDQKGFPTFRNAPGKSIIIGRTEKGEELLRKVIEKGQLLKLREINNFREIDKMQPGQIYKKQFHLARKIAFFLKTGMSFRCNREFYWRATFTKSPYIQLKNFWGAFKRIKK